MNPSNLSFCIDQNIQMTNFPPCAQEKIESTINYLRVCRNLSCKMSINSCVLSPQQVLEYDSVIDYNLIQQYLLDCVPQVRVSSMIYYVPM